MRRMTLGVVVAMGTALAAPALAFNWSGIHWSRSQLPVPYKLNVGSSRELGRTTTLQVVADSFQVWEAPACSAFRATFGGEVTTASANPNDQQNTLLWRYTSWPSELGGSSTIGVTTPVFSSGSGEIWDADIQFNGVNWNWVTRAPQSWGEVDAQSIATHEIGHLLGLDHSGSTAATMYAAYSGGTNERTLSTDDINGVCAIYPSGPGTECSSTVPCPSGKECQNGFCIDTGGGGGQLGEPCDNGCAQGYYCVCTDANQTNCFCTRDCGSTSPCPSGWSCAPLQSGGGACVPGETTGTGQLGDACESGADCQNGICVGISSTQGMCTQLCSSTQPCPSGYSCSPLQGGGGACTRSTTPPRDGGTTPPDGGTPTPDAGTRPPQPLGSTCSAALECQSRWCGNLADASGKVCTQSCSATATCPDGFYCGQLLGGTRGCLRETTAPPEDAGTDPGPGPEPEPEPDADGGRVIRPRASGGCSATGGAAGAGLLSVLVLVAVGLGRRRES
jgi:MYXO-CTERM domain-containing protein